MPRKKRTRYGDVFIGVVLVVTLLLSGCSQLSAPETNVTREEAIPDDAMKITPLTDQYPPQLHSDEWFEPIPFPSPISTAGAEDSAFILPDGATLYFFFTPDVRVPVEQQILDKVTGIYVSRQQNTTWSTPERVMLQDPGKLAGDGCECVLNNIMWFCSVREGYTGVHWFTAEYKNGIWSDWKNADFNPEYKVGELHITRDNTSIFFHSDREGGNGGLDIWFMKKVNNVWQEPEHIEAVNTEENEGWPFVTQNGNELWFTRTYLGSPAIYRSKKVNETWQEPERILSQFAGEPSLDNSGNIYFTHHFYTNGTMIEADIYVAYRK
jgi:hypothetical protein